MTDTKGLLAARDMDFFHRVILGSRLRAKSHVIIDNSLQTLIREVYGERLIGCLPQRFSLPRLDGKKGWYGKWLAFTESRIINIVPLPYKGHDIRTSPLIDGWQVLEVIDTIKHPSISLENCDAAYLDSSDISTRSNARLTLFGHQYGIRIDEEVGSLARVGSFIMYAISQFLKDGSMMMTDPASIDSDSTEKLKEIFQVASSGYTTDGLRVLPVDFSNPARSKWDWLPIGGRQKYGEEFKGVVFATNVNYHDMRTEIKNVHDSVIWKPGSNRGGEEERWSDPVTRKAIVLPSGRRGWS